MTDPIRAAIQQVLDAAGDGWTVADYVVVMGLEKITPGSGEIDTTPWYYAPPQQPEWVTDGLAGALNNMRADVEQD